MSQAADDPKSTFRSAPRASINQPAQLKFSDSMALHSVIITDISESGARIDCKGLSAMVPKEFELLWFSVSGLPPHTLKVRQIWKKGTIYGVRFLVLSEKHRHVLQSFIKFHRPTFKK